VPYLKRGDVSIYYEDVGSGYPILLFAPGSLNSTADLWRGGAAFNPFDELGSEFRLIAMDQRNAGKSWAPITASDGWHSYTEDQVAVLDQLGIDRVHLLGQCIGGPFNMGFIKAQAGRVSCAVLAQPSGRIGPLTDRVTGFDRWRAALTGHPEATPEALDSMRRNMLTNDLVHTVDRDFMRSCQVPLLILAGNDEAHPFALAEEMAQLAPNAEFIPEWKTGEALVTAIGRIRDFLRSHTPAGVA